jgi:hypothetical protein
VRRSLAFVLLGICQAASGLTIYRIELVGGGVVFAQDPPKGSGDRIVFLTSPQGSLVSMKRSEVSRVEAIETENKPAPDYGNAKLREPLIRIRKADPLEAPSMKSGWDAGWKPPRSNWASMTTGRDPGLTIAFPVSADDLKPGNYEPFPAAPGGQSGPPPAYREGQTIPTAGSLRAPPGVIHSGEMPKRANEKRPAPGLDFSEKPRVDPPPLVPPPATTPTATNPDDLPHL